MSDEAQDTQEPEATGTVAAATPTQFQRLRERRQQIGEERTKEVDIPGYNGDLVGVYKLLEWQTVRNILKRMEKAKSQGDVRELLAQCDTIIQACVEIKFRDPNTRKLVPLMDDQTVRYDNNLATVLGFTAANARGIVIETFKNDLAISAHYGELMEWMQGTSPEVDEEALGE